MAKKRKVPVVKKNGLVPQRGGGGINPGSFGSLAFLFGAVIAIIAGLVSPTSPNPVLTSLLISLGIVVGLLNITTKETSLFILSTVSLVIVSALGGAVLGQVAFVGQYLEGILRSILTFVIPATIIVALKTVAALAENK
ncbi:hypothetical protein HYX10_03595 [Candidatus Woesearchaeota archaeon]|nr:hypothetical protein [Candidatus Woesearchaeota archaeon]